VLCCAVTTALCAAATSGLESASYAKSDALANQMGLFLQKTNIIRDYLVSIGPGLGGAFLTVCEVCGGVVVARDGDCAQ
jgi:hypothetical protein